MCDVNSGQEQTLEFPSSLFKRRNGFAMDFGGSGLKMMYTTEVGQMVRFHLILYPRERYNEAFDFLKEKIQGKIDAETTVHLTGYGCEEYSQIIKEKLHKNINILVETRYAVDGIQFMVNNISVEDLLHSPSANAIARAKEFSRVGQERMKRFGGTGISEFNADEMGTLRDTSDIYPCLVSVMGSAAFWIMINKDGSFTPKAMTPGGGKMLLGMGSMLVGTKSCEELMQLAERGDSSKIDLYNNQLELDPSNVYGQTLQVNTTERCLFRFGQTVGKEKDDFEREDLAAALVTHLAETLAMLHQHVALLSDSRRILVCGSLASNCPLFREKLEELFRMNAAIFNHGRSWKPDIHFVKLGGFIGCIGALLKTLEYT